SDQLVLDIWRDGRHYVQRYSRGVPTTPLTDLEPAGTTADGKPKRGTMVRFWPDPTIFTETTEFEYDVLAQRLRELAFLNPGLTITIIDERFEREETFKADGGIVEFVEYLNAGRTPLHAPPIMIRGQRDDIQVEVALQWTTAYAETTYSFVNNINTIEGGTHVSGLKAALTRTLNNYASQSG